MFGGGLVWLYRKLAGMSADPLEPGYRHIIFKPQPVKGLERVTYRNRTPLGDAGISWSQKNGFAMEVTVPVGAKATVYVPAKRLNDVFESGKPVAKSREVVFQEMRDGCAVFRIGSGVYSFTVR